MNSQVSGQCLYTIPAIKAYNATKNASCCHYQW